MVQFMWVALVIVYIYIIAEEGKDMLLNTTKTAKEEEQVFIKKYIPLVIVTALIFIGIGYLMTIILEHSFLIK